MVKRKRNQFEESDEFVPETIAISEYADVPEKELIESGTDVCPGCGVLLGLRLALKIIGENSKIIASGSHADVFGTTSKVPYISTKKLKIPQMHVELSEGENKQIILCYDGTNDVGDIADAVKKCDLVISVVSEPGKDLVRAVSSSVEYAATASISHPIDYLEKIEEALKHKTAFIELLAPCPGSANSGLDASNTVEAAKMAVNSNLFPLYTVVRTEGGLKLKLTYQPSENVAVSEYYRLISITKNTEETDKEQIAVLEEMSRLKKGKF